jgi:hypothetical protein
MIPGLVDVLIFIKLYAAGTCTLLVPKGGGWGGRPVGPWNYLPFSEGFLRSMGGGVEGFGGRASTLGFSLAMFS